MPASAVIWATYLPPRTAHALLVDQFVSCIAYFAISLALASWRSRTAKYLDFTKVLRATVAGVSLPVAVALAAVPFYPETVLLFSQTTMQSYMMLVGLILGVLSIYGLVK